MEKAGIDISQHLHYAGCGDTHIWIEDTGSPLPKGLSALIDHYGLAKCHYTKPLKNGQKWVFIGAHNAGNDAVMTVKLALAQAFDRGLVSGSGKALDMEDPKWFDKPLKGMDVDMILLAYDTESATNARYATAVLNRTTEHAFAWLRLVDVVGIAPGQHGINWNPYIRARHWINKELKHYKNQDFCVGNPHGFWEQYGKSLYYMDQEGPAPFQALFKELADARRVDEAAAAVERLEMEPSAFPSLSNAVSTPQMGEFGRVTLPEKGDNSNMKRSDVGNNWTRGKPWARGPPGGRAREGTSQGSAGGGRTSTAEDRSPKCGPIGNGSTVPKVSAAIIASSTSPTNPTAAASGDRATTTGKPATAKATSSWAQIARGK